MANVAFPTGADVAAFLGRGDDAEIVSLAGVHVGIVLDLARAYTRGKGFDLEQNFCAPEIRSVAVMATARLLVNPEQVKREAFGDYEITPGTLYGWTLVEIQALNRYRARNHRGYAGPVREFTEEDWWDFPETLDGGIV